MARLRTLAMLGLLTAALPLNAAVTVAAFLRGASRRGARSPVVARAAARATTGDGAPRTVLLSGGKMTKSLTLARAFHRAGHRVVLAESGRYRLTGHRFSRAVDRFRTVPEPTDPGYAEGLLEIVRDEGVDVYVPVCSPVSSVADAHAKPLLEPHCEVVHVGPDVKGPDAAGIREGAHPAGPGLWVARREVETRAALGHEVAGEALARHRGRAAPRRARRQPPAASPRARGSGRRARGRQPSRGRWRRGRASPASPRRGWRRARPRPPRRRPRRAGASRRGGRRGRRPPPPSRATAGPRTGWARWPRPARGPRGGPPPGSGGGASAPWRAGAAPSGRAARAAGSPTSRSPRGRRPGPHSTASRATRHALCAAWRKWQLVRRQAAPSGARVQIAPARWS